MTAVFFTATGTDIGKTYLLRKLLDFDQANPAPTLTAIKPLISGWSNHPDAVYHSDTGLLLQAQGLTLTQEHVQAISPWRYEAPVAPDLAQRLENRVLEWRSLMAFCQQAIADAQTRNKLLCIEGVGGLMSPITTEHTVLDWIVALNIPAVLVTGSYLGSISHVLTAVHVMQNAGIVLPCILLNESEHSPVSLAETQESIEQFTEIPIIKFARNQANTEGLRFLHRMLTRAFSSW